MAIDPSGSNGRNVFIRFSDPNKGTREAAANLWFDVVQHEDIDPRANLALNLGSEWDAYHKLRQLWREQEQSYEAQIDHLSADITLIRGELALSRDSGIKALQAEIGKLRRQLADTKAKTSDTSHAHQLYQGSQARIKELEAALAKATVDRDQAREAYHASQVRVKELEAALADLAKSEPLDEWHGQVVRWLNAQPGKNRHPTFAILKEAVGIAEGAQNAGAFRRLGAIMRRMGGWRPSPNVPLADGRRVRGYIRGLY